MSRSDVEPPGLREITRLPPRGRNLLVLRFTIRLPFVDDPIGRLGQVTVGEVTEYINLIRRVGSERITDAMRRTIALPFKASSCCPIGPNSPVKSQKCRIRNRGQGQYRTPDKSVGIGFRGRLARCPKPNSGYGELLAFGHVEGKRMWLTVFSKYFMLRYS